MFIQNDATYQIGKNALDAYSLRQQTISHNIANVNTENFKAKTVSFENELKQALSQTVASLKTTNSKHFGTINSAVRVQASVDQTKSSTFMNLDGNNVDIDTENAELASNQIRYNGLMDSINREFQNLQSVMK